MLDRLVAQGIVIRERAGAAHLYQLNRLHLAAPAIEDLSSLRTQLIERLRKIVSKWTILPAAAILFGSVARGDSASSSDIDLLVVRSKGAEADYAVWRRQVTDLAVQAKAMTGNDARVVEYSDAEVRRLGRRDALLAAATKEGIALAGSLQALITRGRKRTSRR